MQPQWADPVGLSLPFVQVHELCDSATGERRQLSVSQSHGGSAAPKASRLLVLLDGNLTVVPAALMLHTRGERDHGCLPACTVAGVGYPDVRFYDQQRRARDFLPALPEPLDAATWPGGRADAFSAFLDAQLLPWLEAQQGHAYTEIGLFGHSYGGLFTLYKLLHQPARFNAFFSISPSLWWGNGWLLDRLGPVAQQCAGRSVFLGIGADERAMPGADATRVDLHKARDVQGRFARLVHEFQLHNVACTAETYAGEDHGSVLYPALTRAVRWLIRPAGNDHNALQH
ncbi:MAG: alpha/beta hydrolase-fold protein [Rhodoferax sp.]|nr:alpha/beta hydrolase-fold protein [Rhodoferax sp.]